ncbi:MAG: gas vesicle protein [Chloroflexi bacterium]|nr:gas vesicle protein [Chloroflexota bacterium]
MVERRPVQQATSLIDILDRVLDKGLVVAGDIRVSLANVELLTVKIRLIVCSIDKAEQIGLDWWRRDEFLSSGADGAATAALRERIEALERRLPAGPSGGPGRRSARRQSAAGR